MGVIWGDSVPPDTRPARQTRFRDALMNVLRALRGRVYPLRDRVYPRAHS